MRKLTAVCCLVLVATGCTNNRNGHMVSVAAAANLTAPLSEMERQFERLHPDIGLEVSFGASGVLTTQILQGAPFQVFLSADTALPENLHARGRDPCQADGIVRPPHQSRHELGRVDRIQRLVIVTVFAVKGMITPPPRTPKDKIS